MGQLLVMVIAPPIIGLATYAIIRLLRRSDDDLESGVTSRRRRDA
jgi:hypothetical protein